MADTTFLTLLEVGGTVAPAVSPAGRARVYFDSGTNRLRLSENAGAYVNFGLSLEPALVVSQGTTGQTTVTVTQPVNTTGSPTALRVTGGAHTALTASTEAIDVAFDLARTVQWSTGALTTQRAVRITAPTYGFVGASVVADTATFAITNSPQLGANATFTRSFALWIEAGSLGFGALAARSGDIRGDPTFSIVSRNAADANDRSIIDFGVTTAERVTVGNTGSIVEVFTAGGGFNIRPSGVLRISIIAASLEINSGTNANYSIIGNGEQMIGFNIAAAGVRNIAFFNDGSTGMNSMDGGLFLLNAVAVPAGNPTGGGYLYATGGAGTWRGSGGTITTFGPA